jgi:hypothetical protein
MKSKGLSRFIPNAVLDAYKPSLADGWELATFMFLVAVWLGVIGDFIVDFSVSFDAGLDGLWAASGALFVGLPVLMVIITLVVRHQAPHSTPRGLWFLDGAVTLSFALGALGIVAGVIGIFTSFGNSGFGGVVGDILFHVADIALGVAVVVWSLNELGVLRKYAPVAAPAVATATWGAPAPTAAATAPVAAEPPAPPTAPSSVTPPPPPA